ncbi:type II toxin-antitoxin system VapC family toxin [Pseudaminobacter sp. NGMCC 1.201702]|uniref:type II toxin-antitoxin system VapC family toxin n=1 Tax=Pseudaminobacter sp. NGMCC 1.201702 TaxID=3391825 RepID=UPI0039F03F9C
MYLDSSAVVAILLDEPEAHQLLSRLYAAGRTEISVVNKVEAALSIGRIIKDYSLAGRLVAEFLDKVGAKISAVAPESYDDVLQAYTRYGKGTGHPAKLNFGDCFSYAFAKRSGVPLLYKGEDFSQTDLAG